MRSPIVLMALVLSLTFLSGPVLGQADFTSLPLTGPAPTIDGIRSVNEWTGLAQIQMDSPNYPIQTDVYFRHDQTYLYVLVDALGDVTDEDMDECLLVFDLPPNMKIAEVWLQSGTVTPRPGTVADLSGMSMTNGHRTYEFRIPFSSLGIQPGGTLPFYSPQFIKFNGYFNYYASIPYDSGNATIPNRDNVYPYNLTLYGSYENATGFGNYTMLQVGDEQEPIPTLTEWGMVLLSLLLAGASLFLSRGRQKV